MERGEQASTARTGRRAIVAIALATGAYGLWAAFGPDPAAEEIVSSVELLGLQLLFAALALRLGSLSRTRPRLRRAWLLLALSGISGALAEGVWYYVGTIEGSEPHFGIADAFFWLQGLAQLTGTLSLPFSARSRQERWLFTLDIGIVLTFGLMTLWGVVLLRPAVGADTGPAVYFASYLFLGLLVLAAATALAQSEVAGVTRPTLSLLAGGLLLSVAANAASVYAILLEVPIEGRILNAAWVAAQACLAFGVAWEASRAGEPDAKRPLRPGVPVALPHLAALLAIALLAAALESRPYDWGQRGLLLGVLLIIGLVLLRQHVMLQDNARLYAEARHTAATDALTGLRTRLYVDNALRAELGRAHRHGHPLSLLVMDVDDFKVINDRHGHAAGDRVLVQIAAALRSQARASDVVGRFGGDEFVAILPETSTDGARELAARMRRSVGLLSFEGLVLSLSVGIASLAPEMSAEDLLESADRDMYQQKALKRPRIPPGAGEAVVAPRAHVG